MEQQLPLDPFHAGGQYLSVPGIQQRRRSSANPEILDNNQILLVDTDVSSLDLSLEREVQLAGNISNSVVSTTGFSDTKVVVSRPRPVISNCQSRCRD